MRSNRFGAMSLGVIALAAAVPAARQVPVPRRTTETPLDRYVAAPDPAYAWKAVKDVKGDGVTATIIDMTSQRWLTEQEVEQSLWRHWLIVVRPDRVTSDIGLLFITG